MRTSVPPAVHDAARETLDLLLPSDCVVCGRRAHRCCPECRARLESCLSRVRRVEDQALSLPLLADARPLPVYAAAAYEGDVSTALLAFKDHGALHLADLLGAGLGRALRAAVASARVHEGGGRGPSGSAQPDVVAVPVPDSWSGYVRRGYAPLEELLAAAGESPVPVDASLVRPALPAPSALWRPSRSHAGASAAQRRARRRGWRVRGSLASGTRVVLVDDVVTTGATLAALAHAVRSAGGVPVAAAAVAGVPRRRRTGDDTHSGRD